jgi:hypothetical protein
MKVFVNVLHVTLKLVIAVKNAMITANFVKAVQLVYNALMDSTWILQILALNACKNVFLAKL